MPVSSTFAFPGATARRNSAIHRLFSELASWHRRHRQRLDFAGLDDWLLADIGVTPHEARHESAKPFWR
ncbi:DUF1127 domain-containing protein [Mesorhizobium sp. 8]|uniref:DUF1127 domain-containing protein n=1 Tax=Mesorhizobium sp. 8 TaxID=2584466 RepID=UPI00112135EB|nr:DUF1127 domain-containing protein [Mesorhizobium sp. 8]QDC02125.1 DUF1127 domain-containing protein [Mesorhizobium sp. 8]